MSASGVVFRCAIVCPSTDRVQANAVGQEFTARLADIGIGAPLLLWADQTRWADLNTGDMGLLTATARENIAAAPKVRTAPASPLGFAGWLRGDGALAWCALDQVPEGKPYALANLVAAAVQGGSHPREWAASKASSADYGVEALAPRQATPDRGTPRRAMGI